MVESGFGSDGGIVFPTYPPAETDKGISLCLLQIRLIGEHKFSRFIIIRGTHMTMEGCLDRKIPKQVTYNSLTFRENRDYLTKRSFILQYL